MKRITAITLAFLALTSILHGENWPQFLGPARDSTSTETGLLRSWPDDGPEVLWTTKVGKGFGGPVAVDGKVYLLDRDDEVGDNLRCFDFANGKELWNFAYDAPGSVSFPGSRSVPTVDGSHVYTCGHNGDLYCVNIDTHEAVWKKNVWTDFGGELGGGYPRGPGPASRFPIWAVTQNPLIYGDLLIVASQAPDAGVVAYDKLRGEVRWKTPSLGYVGYVSPTIIQIYGEDHVVMVTPSTNPFRRTTPDEENMGTVVGIDPLTGDKLWEYDKWHCHITVAPAIGAGDNRILVVGGYELGATMIQVEKQDDGSYATKELFTTEEFGDQTKPAILHNGYFYAQYGTNRRRDGLCCMSSDGKIMWKTKRKPSFNKGSMILVDGLILATDGEKSLYLIEPHPSEFKPLASAELLDAGERGGRGGGLGPMGGGTQNWAPIALSNGKLLLRDQTQLKCVRVGK